MTNDAYSIEERILRVEIYLQAARALLAVALDADDDQYVEDARDRLCDGLELLLGLRQAMPFPLSEYRGEPITDWLTERSGHACTLKQRIGRECVDVE